MSSFPTPLLVWGEGWWGGGIGKWRVEGVEGGVSGGWSEGWRDREVEGGGSGRIKE